ncbi:MAG: hypothetical protein ACTSWY_03715 [Promethearchaeota archaeon]
MTVRILVDLIHNENYNKIPNDIFDLDYLFNFLNPGGLFPRIRELKRYDLLIIGEIIPSPNQKDHLFHDDEIKAIIKYVKQGGRLLLTTSSGGDFNYKRSQGSIRALNRVTGVNRYWWGELFNKNPGSFLKMTENLVITEFSNHEIFREIKKVILADCTFFKTVKKQEVEEILLSNSNTYFRSYSNDSERKIGRVPIIITRKINEGKALTVGSSFFMTEHKEFGIKAADNAKLFKNIIDWLLK